MKLIFNKKLIFGILTICLLSFLILSQITLAETGKELVNGGLKKTAQTGGLTVAEEDEEPTLAAMIGRAINSLLGIVGVIFLTVTLIGGFLWMTAGGNEEKVAKAKKLLSNGFTGIAIIFLAYALVFVILSRLRAAIGEQ